MGYGRSTVTTDAPFDAVVTDLDQLMGLYRAPHELVSRKKIDHIDAGARALIAASPFVLMATSDAQGRCTVSPRGGPPGFVQVIDPHRIAVPDFPGNNLIDSLHNLLANRHAGLLFVLPGRGELMRVEGSAWITTDPTILSRCADGERRPVAAVGVAVESVFVHCSAALRRGRLWEPGSWDEIEAPTTTEVYRGHIALTDPDATT